MKFIAKTLYGLENVLASEIKELGASGVSPLNRAVAFNGNKEMLYRANYCCRTALSILMPVADFRIGSADDLYKNASRINWGEYLESGQTFLVIPVVNSPVFRHTGYPALVIKDAVADWFRERKNRRPSVNSSDPDLVINLHISNDQVNVSLDSSVVPLFKRGYRKVQGAAPMNEALAAGIILLSGWDKKMSLSDPMCGSGTIPIEAALIASGIPPGSFRTFFGFQKWNDYDSPLFERIKRDCEAKVKKPEVRIYASDISGEAVTQTGLNAASASVSDLITIEQRDFSESMAKESQGYLIMNPPYGQRIKPSEPEILYQMIGNVLKHNFPGYTALIITAGKDFIKQIGLRPSAKTILYNGALECTLARYELYEGSKKMKSIG